MRRYVLVAVAAVIGLGVVQADEMSFPKRMPADIPGAPTLGAPFLVMAGDGPVLTGKQGLAAPALWDFNGDGKRDLLVGEFETNGNELFPMGADGSTVRVYLNVGTDSAPKFSEAFEWARDTEGAIIEVPQWCCIGFTPQFFDLDDDGYQDMITGQYHPGEVTWFRGSPAGFMPGKTLPQEGNPDSHGQPGWQDYDGEPGDIGTFAYWAYTSATFGDLDDDGDYDLIVGGSGGLRVSENVGGRKNPSFAQRVRLLDVEGHALQTRPYTEGQLQRARSGGLLPPASDFKTSPLAVDWNQDGVLDLLVTDSYRNSNSRAVSFFRGVKTPDGHRFEPGVDLLPAENGAKALPGSGQRVYVDDWNRDGVNDLIIGASVATVNGGEFSDELSWEWEAVNKVESAGKDPGRYPPRPRPTRESLSSYYKFDEMTEEEIEELVQFNVRSWEDSEGRFNRENKGHWRTLRHRNRRIGEFLKELGLAEGRSTGVPKILRAMRENGSPAPVFESNKDRTSFLVRLPVHEKAGQEASRQGTSQGTLQDTLQDTDQVTDQVEQLVAVLSGEMGRTQLQAVLGLAHRRHFTTAYLKPALAAGLIEMTLPDKPTSRNQRYRRTAAGQALADRTKGKGVSA